MERKLEYVAIDFETANANLTSACSIGIVGAFKGKTVFEKHYLINPNEEFLSYNVQIHGITHDMVVNEPTFDKLWDEIKELIDGAIVFAHCAPFDLAVLKSLLDKYDLEYPNIKVGCTLKVSKIAFKGILENCKLNTISNYLEVDHNHHNAISDALVCFHLLERVKRMYQVYDVVDLFEVIGLGFGSLKDKILRSCFNKFTQISTSQTKSNRLEGKIIAFSGKPKTMTKTEAKKLVEVHGGIYTKDINKAITTFVVFLNPVKTQLNALNRVLEFKEVEVLNEEQFRKHVISKGDKNDY